MASCLAGTGKHAGADEYFLELDCDDADASGPLALADTRCRLSMYDRATLRPIGAAGMAHGGRVHCVRHARLGASSAATFLSASEDGHIRAWDVGQGLSRAAVDLAGPTDATMDDGCGLSGVDADGSGMLVAAGGESRVLLWDVRMGGRVLRSYDEVHTEACTAVRFHAGKPSMLVTGSVDGLLCLLDGTLEPDDDELILTACNPGDAVVHAGTFGAWGEESSPHAYCVGGTDTLSVWNIESGLNRGSWADVCKRSEQDDEEGAALQPVAPAGSGLDYMLDCVFWQAGAPTLLLVAGTHTGEVELLAVRAGDSQPRPLALGGSEAHCRRAGHSTTVRACTLADAARNLYTIGEDGLICCWNTAALLPADGHGRAGAATSVGGHVGAPLLSSERSGDAEGVRPRQRAIARRKLVPIRSSLVANSSLQYMRWAAASRAGARLHWLGRVRACARSAPSTRRSAVVAEHDQ
jgi:WD40 repeat protein